MVDTPSIHKPVVKNGLIFVQIASYRDPELKNTVENLIENADNPENLRICIAWQHSVEDEWDNIIADYGNDIRFKIIDINYKNTHGACWARHQIQEEYGGEEYTLCIDSHHRFVKGWDSKCIKMMNQLHDMGHDKPLLTAYLPSFQPDKEPDGRLNQVWQMNFDRFIPEGAVFFIPSEIPQEKDLSKPIPSRFLSAHFVFTLGQFCDECMHHPKYYFHGEEISLAARAFTWGYDLFHPNEVVVWHEYTRKGRTKQWDDNKAWVIANDRCHRINRKLFGMEDNTEYVKSIYGFGNHRTLSDYEHYSGLWFKQRKIQPEVLDPRSVPKVLKGVDRQSWEGTAVKYFKHCIDIQYNQLAHRDYDLAVIALHKEGEGDTTIWRRDAGEGEISGFFSDPDEYCKVWIYVDNLLEIPTKWVVWFHSKAHDWAERFEGGLHNV